MKVAHFVVITPGRCGLYETTRELVTALRARGIDSRMFDPTREKNTLYPEGTEDRGALFADDEWLETSDVYVNHSGLGNTWEKTTQPVVHVAHGRPRHSFLSEKSGSTPIYSYHYEKNQDPRFKAIVTFWPEHVEYLKFMFPDKPVECVQSCVDLDHWHPKSSKKYDFQGLSGTVNAVVADSWRDDIDPFVPMNAFGLWAREARSAKLHLYGRQGKSDRGYGALVKRLREDGNMGVYTGWVKGLEHVYRSATMVVTGNEIDVRTVREAMACGCPVVKFPSADIADFRFKFARALEADRGDIRRQAEDLYNPAVTAEQFERVLINAVS